MAMEELPAKVKSAFVGTEEARAMLVLFRTKPGATYGPIGCHWLVLRLGTWRRRRGSSIERGGRLVTAPRPVPQTPQAFAHWRQGH